MMWFWATGSWLGGISWRDAGHGNEGLVWVHRDNTDRFSRLWVMLELQIRAQLLCYTIELLHSQLLLVANRVREPGQIKPWLLVKWERLEVEVEGQGVEPDKSQWRPQSRCGQKIYHAQALPWPCPVSSPIRKSNSLALYGRTSLSLPTMLEEEFFPVH